MSRYFDCKDLYCLKVIDIKGLKKFIDTGCNGEDLKHLIHLDYTPNPSEDKLDWTVEIGLKQKKYGEETGYESDLCKDINHFSPEDCTFQMFFNELSKYTESFDFCVFDEEFPVLDDQLREGHKDSVFAWRIYVKKKGEIVIKAIKLVESHELKDISNNHTECS